MLSSLYRPQASTSWIYSKGNTPKFCPEYGVGYAKSIFRYTKALISMIRGKISPRLLLTTNKKTQARFRLVPKSTTVGDLEGLSYTLFQNTCVFRSLSWTFACR